LKNGKLSDDRLESSTADSHVSKRRRPSFFSSKIPGLLRAVH